MTNMKILGIPGSLRKESFHAKLLRAAAKLAPEGVTVEIAGIGDLPLFNQDLEQNPPESVKEIKKKIKKSDAVLFVTPEYNYSVPGVLKNAIDWASRPYSDSAWAGKPAGIMSGSVGLQGGAKAQYHLRQSFVFLNMYPLNKPEVMVPMIQDKFDAEGNLTDEETKKRVIEYLAALADWARKING
jgi:chromate reductase